MAWWRRRPRKPRRIPTIEEKRAAAAEMAHSLVATGIGILVAVLLRMTLQPDLHRLSDPRFVHGIVASGVALAAWGAFLLHRQRRRRIRESATA